jgi:hypothetical protein
MESAIAQSYLGTTNSSGRVDLSLLLATGFPKVMIADTHRKRILRQFRKSIFTRSISHLKKQCRVTYPSGP